MRDDYILRRNDIFVSVLIIYLFSGRKNSVSYFIRFVLPHQYKRKKTSVSVNLKFLNLPNVSIDVKRAITQDWSVYNAQEGTGRDGYNRLSKHVELSSAGFYFSFFLYVVISM